ncbi:MAG: EscU/YscU/HrcU family type III secretion system export apparatus switch protein [Thermoleophilaceae bacterium]|nr:EscU/YscU/HrcU family type III secretion system export apparatus switch protein [Thermoleophilaceae bacterium]
MPDERRATALRYLRGESAAPKVVASGRGHLAERILELARAHGVPIREDPALAEALAALDLGEEIPEDLYVAVAEALVWALGLDRRASRAGRGGPGAAGGA